MIKNVIVQDGEFGISSVIKAARPALHDGGILRSARTAMKNFDGPVNQQLTLKYVKGRKTQMAGFDTCKYILDNLPGQSWVEWRTTHGDSFKESLAQLVHQEPAEEVQAETVGFVEHRAAVQDQEAKESTLKKAFRTLNIDGSARIDEASGKVSIIDVILLLSPGVSREYASQMLIRLLEKDNATRLGEALQNADLSVPLADRVSHIKINGVGHVTPVCDAKTIIEIIWDLPTTAGKSFKRESAQVICQVMGGDVSLCAEIEARNDRLQSTPQGQAFQNFVLGGNGAEEPQAKRTRIGPEIMELASEEQYAEYVKVGLDNELTKFKNEVVKTEVSLVMSLKDAFERIRPLEDRHMIELCDRLSDIQGRAFRSTEVITSVDSPVNAVALAAPATSRNQQQDPGHDIPTPQCSRGVRGQEVSIAMIATEMGVSIRGRGGLVGKKLKALYAERYGQNAASSIPKRSTTYCGRPYLENMYFSRDRDLVERAVRIVVG